MNPYSQVIQTAEVAFPGPDHPGQLLVLGEPNHIKVAQVGRQPLPTCQVQPFPDIVHAQVHVGAVEPHLHLMSLAIRHDPLRELGPSLPATKVVDKVEATVHQLHGDVVATRITSEEDQASL